MYNAFSIVTMYEIENDFLFVFLDMLMLKLRGKIAVAVKHK